MKRVWITFSVVLIYIALCLVGNGIGQGGDEADGGCICNPEDNNTGPVCANDAVTYSSACDFRLKQGLRTDLGIRCVGDCPCDESVMGVGVDCSTVATAIGLASPSTGLEFCATNGATYHNENMFVCDQIQDPSLAIACPGACPCQLVNCPSMSSVPPTSRGPTTIAPRLPLPPLLLNNTARDRVPLSPPSPYQPGPGQSPYSNNIPGLATPWQTYSPPGAPPLLTPPMVPYPIASPPLLPPNESYGYSFNPVNSGAALSVPQVIPQLQPRPVISGQQPVVIVPFSRPSGYGSGGGGGGEAVVSVVPTPTPLSISPPPPAPSYGNLRDNQRASAALLVPPPIPSAVAPSGYNPLTEALRSVPFRLFRHLYILITVASEGMKQIPFQIAKNMQSRLPPYVREIPVQLAEAIQEAMAIHFDSLARQVKDTVDAVRNLLDNDNVN